MSGFTTITAARIQDASGRLLSSGKAFQLDDTMGRARFENIQLKDISCANFAPGVFQNYYNTGMSMADLTLVNVVPVYTTANHCMTSLITDGGGAIAFGRLAVNGFRVVNETGTNTMPYLLNFSSGSTVDNFTGMDIDLTSVGEFMPAGQATQVHSYDSQVISTHSHTAAPQAAKKIVDQVDGSTSFECMYQLGPGDNSYNLSLGRDCATGAFPVSRVASYFQLTSPSSGWSQALFAVGSTPNALPGFGMSVGNGTCFGTALAGYGCTPGDGNIQSTGVLAGNGNMRMYPCPWATTYNCATFNAATDAPSNLGISGGGPGDGNFYYNALTGSSHHLQINGVDLFVFGDATAPSGTCSVAKQTRFSQDKHATYCPSAGGAWTSIY